MITFCHLINSRAKNENPIYLQISQNELIIGKIINLIPILICLIATTESSINRITILSIGLASSGTLYAADCYFLCKGSKPFIKRVSNEEIEIEQEMMDRNKQALNAHKQKQRNLQRKNQMLNKRTEENKLILSKCQRENLICFDNQKNSLDNFY